MAIDMAINAVFSHGGGADGGEGGASGVAGTTGAGVAGTIGPGVTGPGVDGPGTTGVNGDGVNGAAKMIVLFSRRTKRTTITILSFPIITIPQNIFPSPGISTSPPSIADSC